MNISSITKCVNCGACYNECAINAIIINCTEMFYSPEINFKKCVDCGRCITVCPMSENTVINNAPNVAYGLWSKNNEVVLNSSSGGAFYGLAQKVIRSGGVIYGASFSEDNRGVVFTSTDFTDLLSIMKSKYVESLVLDTFRKIKEDLVKGRDVLFCGTPCQVQGLIRFLKKDYKNLITCDFSCGGLPSHFLYEKHLDSLEAKYKSKVKKVDFRPKTHGWNRHAINVEFKNGKKYNRLAILDDYFKAFLHGKYSVRESCLNCKFGKNHASDITLADFWKYKQISKLNNELGISLVLCNTEKGKIALEEILYEYEWELLDIEKASYNLKDNKASADRMSKRKAFLDSCKEVGLEKASKIHLKFSFYDKVKAQISNKLRRRK